jgi:cell division protein FtsN
MPEEDAINKFIIDANDELRVADGGSDAQVVDDVSLAKGFGVNFKRQSAMAADKGIFGAGENELALDKGPINVLGDKGGNPETVRQKQTFIGTTYGEEVLGGLTDEAGITPPLSSVGYGQDVIKNQINGYEYKLKKAKAISYAALGFGIAALLSAVVMGVILSSMHTKVSKLTELVSILEEDMSVVAEKNSDLELNNSDLSNEQLSQKASGLADNVEEVENPQTTATAQEKNKRPEAIAERMAAEKKLELPQHAPGQSQPPPERSKSNPTAVAEKPETLNIPVDKQKIKAPDVGKKKPPETTVKTTSANKKTNTARDASSWSVNLTAYEDLNYAKRKAANFIQKGVPVKIVAVDMNNTKWYRLQVDGFKNKEDAVSYAAKIKKLHHLNTIFVANI